jgi:hypothetical protein
MFAGAGLSAGAHSQKKSHNEPDSSMSSRARPALLMVDRILPS